MVIGSWSFSPQATAAIDTQSHCQRTRTAAGAVQQETTANQGGKPHGAGNSPAAGHALGSPWKEQAVKQERAGMTVMLGCIRSPSRAENQNMAMLRWARGQCGTVGMNPPKRTEMKQNVWNELSSRGHKHGQWDGRRFKRKESEEEWLGLLIFCIDPQTRNGTRHRDKAPYLSRGRGNTEDPNCETPAHHVPGVTLRLPSNECFARFI